MKRKLIKRLSLLITVALTFSSLVGCGANKNEAETSGAEISENFNATGMPIVNDQIVIKAFTQIDPLNKDYNEMSVLDKFDEGTGVDVQYECINAKVWEEKKNLVLASGDLPDIFFGGGLSNGDIAKYGSMGVLVPLEDLIDKYAPNIKKLFDENPEIKKASTSADGHIYTLPYIDGYKPEDVVTHLFINKTWLDKLGLEVPATTDEYYEVMKEFKEKDPNGNGKADEIPLSYRVGNNYNGDFSFSGAFGVFDNMDHVMIKDGKVSYTVTDDGYKEYIKWTNKMYKEGLIDQEVFTQDQGQYVGKGKMEEQILGSFMVYNADSMVGEEQAVNDYIALKPLKGPNGDQLWGSYVKDNRGPKFAMTNANKNPEATIRWIDQFFNQEDVKALEVHLGEVGTILGEKDGKYEVVNSDAAAKWENCPGPYAPGIVSVDTYDNKLIANDAGKRKSKYYEEYKEFLAEPLPLLSFTNEELTRLGELKTDLNNYIDEMKGKWTTGQSNVESDWEAYKEQLKKMGCEEYVKIYTDAYERYKK